MPWVVGVDEAGYGPNLGPLVQCAVAVRVPAAGCDVWGTLGEVVARAKPRCRDERLIIDDSKAVHALAHGLRHLERGVFATAPFDAGCLMSYLTATLADELLAELRSEFWFDAPPPYSVEISPWHDRFRSAARSAGVVVGPIRTSVVQPTRFNAIVDASGTKATVLADGLIALVRSIHAALTDDEPVSFLADKLGGRNAYAPLISAAFPDGWVHPLVEGASDSRYRVSGLGRELELRFCPRADGLHWAVALASMVCKYVREACMEQFNRWWAARVPGVKPTAGYPVDALRFLGDVRGAMATHGIAESVLWRKK